MSLTVNDFLSLMALMVWMLYAVKYPLGHEAYV